MRVFDLWKLPISISRLRKLKYMYLGAFPKELGLLRNLQVLELYDNRLVGQIPQELGHLAHLTDIDISNNMLIDTVLHLQITQIKSSTSFWKQSHWANPASVRDSKSLERLSLYNNSFTGEIPWGLGRLDFVIGFYATHLLLLCLPN
ncbi:leucine-rich repeat transmembrane protein kinase family protein [Artemisia annua]|uniref:Leucine-rich repeat transmembrane protein kinase family protein n=1 Tax=Artemisia annua TaxID=35608 RepID=A0A2U1M5Z3_ARTAN|nr:leucine-rich repeat transmembrane protein kinase family protein [Artemisia annua]